jgi:hypothetical protein
MSQSRRGSLAEALVSTAVGYVINLTANYLLLPLWGIHISLGANLELGVIFTVISVVRSFLLRRAFNAYHTQLL